jgi:galactokinase
MNDYRISEGSVGSSAETRDFVDELSSTKDPSHLGKNYFTGDEPVIVTRAPGRLDVMGGIADYSGSLVLQLPLAYATHVAIQKVDSTNLRVLSLGGSDQRYFEIELAELLSNNNSPIDYDDALRRFAESSDQWAAHVIGAVLVLMHERDFRCERGAHILIKSSVPEGKGVSSSAAIEVASMQAIAAAFEVDLTPTVLATLCQKVENLVAGAPSGIMDQMTSSCGEENKLLELLCQPDVLLGSLTLPEELQLWGIDSGVRHSVGGADYGTVRTAAFMGYRIIAEIAQLPTSTDQVGKVEITDSKWRGYLANITPAEFEDNYDEALPHQMRGDVFLERYHGITDKVTSVNPTTVYPVRQATRHPIYENNRVQSFASILKNWRGLEQAPQLGTLMFGSHQSYSDCGLGSEATDLIVKLVKESLDGGLFGARITGGGSGGTVAVLGSANSGPVIEKVRRLFQKQTGYEPLIISGSSPGAAIFDFLKLEKLTTATNSTAV